PPSISSACPVKPSYQPHGISPLNAAPGCKQALHGLFALLCRSLPRLNFFFCSPSLRRNLGSVFKSRRLDAVPTFRRRGLVRLAVNPSFCLGRQLGIFAGSFGVDWRFSVRCFALNRRLALSGHFPAFQTGEVIIDRK